MATESVEMYALETSFALMLTKTDASESTPVAKRKESVDLKKKRDPMFAIGSLSTLSYIVDLRNARAFYDGAEARKVPLRWVESGVPLP
tara:strand:+ start:2276 stop:2542 length:267 start_codon:yes stop_codon:yes gene_type:complete